MLLWINGPFGGGKTHVAGEIQHRLPNTWIADPELAGFGLHRMMPPSARQDFQDLPAWRRGVVEALDIALQHHDGLVVAPQTIVNLDYFNQIVGSLRSLGHEVHHVALMARADTVLQRLRDRGFGRVVTALGRDPLARESFAVARVESYLAQLAELAFAEHVWTDDLTVAQVAEAVADATGLQLAPAQRPSLRTWLRRTGTTIRHMRFD